MSVFLIAFSSFNLFAAAAAAATGMRLLGEEERTGWASARLYAIALLLCWGMAVIALGATAIAWSMAPRDPHYALVVLAPMGWLLVMGAIFAAFDFAEDGVFDFGRGRREP